MPRLEHVVTVWTGKPGESSYNHFSYEDIGLLRLYVILTLMLGLLFVLLFKTFLTFLRVEKTWMAPHPVIIYGLTVQLLAVFLQMINLYIYSKDG